MVKQGMLGPEATNGNNSGKALRETALERRVMRCRNQLSQRGGRALSEAFEDGVSRSQRRRGCDPGKEAKTGSLEPSHPGCSHL